MNYKIDFFYNLMNIFLLSMIRRKNCKYHCDKHVVKMILEYAQLLCTAIWISGGEAPYKKTHINHPCSKWCRSSKKNWKWLRGLALCLCDEYTYRYGKIHKTRAVIESLKCPVNLPIAKFTKPPQCMPDEYKCDNTVTAYRLYYICDKSHIFKWTKRNKPPFTEPANYILP